MALWRAARLGTSGKIPEFRLPPEGGWVNFGAQEDEIILV